MNLPKFYPLAIIHFVHAECIPHRLTHWTGECDGCMYQKVHKDLSKSTGHNNCCCILYTNILSCMKAKDNE